MQSFQGWELRMVHIFGTWASMSSTSVLDRAAILCGWLGWVWICQVIFISNFNSFFLFHHSFIS